MKVVIIGAGLSGLTAAYRLHQQGIDVSVYEARSRVGGRVLSAKIKDQVIELGGQNIADGGEAKHLLSLVHEFNLPLADCEISINLDYFSNGTLISMQKLLEQKAFSPRSLKKELKILQATSKNMKEVLIKLIGKQDDLYTALAVRLAGYEGGNVEDLSTYYVETLYHMLLGGASSVHPAGENESVVHLLNLQEGNSSLAEHMAHLLRDRLHISHALTSISKDRAGKFTLTFNHHSLVKSDIVVFTNPCTTYKHIDIAQEVIPFEKLQAIKQVGYGMNSKIIVPLEQGKSKKTGLVNQRMGCFFGSNHPLLTLYYTGDASRFSAQTIQKTYDEEKSMIELGFGKLNPNAQVAHYAKDEAYVIYPGPVGFNWTDDPYALGSYSYIAAGQEKAFTTLENAQGEKVKTLFAPINRLYFAGEHTSILKEAFGTMEAACESGERTARMILNTL